MFSEIFGSQSAGRVLIFVAHHGEAYTRQISGSFEISPQMVHEQLLRFERKGLMNSRKFGNLRLFSLDSNHPLYNEILPLLKKAFDSLPQKEKKQIDSRKIFTPKTSIKKILGSSEQAPESNDPPLSLL